MSVQLSRKAQSCRRKFLRVFPDGFRDERYLAWERDYKWQAHKLWIAQIGRQHEHRSALESGRAATVAAAAVRIESSRSLLFSFEKMALRDAVTRSPAGARDFATGLFDWLYGTGTEQHRFETWADVVRTLPKRQTRVATWPVTTVFGFIARPRFHMFVKPTALQRAARAYGFDLDYSSQICWATYQSVLEFARTVRADITDLRPRDQIDIQSFLWVQGSDEYS